MQQKYTIGLCDILGFKSHVKKTPLDTIVNESDTLFRSILWHSIHQKDFPEHKPELSELQNHADIGLLCFSDTILLYTKQDSDSAFLSLLSTLAWLLCETMYECDLRLRCGVSYGEAYIDAKNSIVIGQPIIDANELEKKQAWSGGALCETAFQRIPQEVHDGEYFGWPVVPYSVPCKNGEVEELLAIDWTIGAHLPNIEWSPDHPEPTVKDCIEKFDICQKWYNMMKFFNEQKTGTGPVLS